MWTRQIIINAGVNVIMARHSVNMQHMQILGTLYKTGLFNKGYSFNFQGKFVNSLHDFNIQSVLFSVHLL